MLGDRAYRPVWLTVHLHQLLCARDAVYCENALAEVMEELNELVALNMHFIGEKQVGRMLDLPLASFPSALSCASCRRCCCMEESHISNRLQHSSVQFMLNHYRIHLLLLLTYTCTHHASPDQA